MGKKSSLRCTIRLGIQWKRSGSLAFKRNQWTHRKREHCVIGPRWKKRNFLFIKKDTPDCADITKIKERKTKNNVPWLTRGLFIWAEDLEPLEKTPLVFIYVAYAHAPPREHYVALLGGRGPRLRTPGLGKYFSRSTNRSIAKPTTREGSNECASVTIHLSGVGASLMSLKRSPTPPGLCVCWLSTNCEY